MEPQLSERKREILRRLVEEYVETGQPVGSKGLVERSRMTVSPSTVRNELAELELLGLLAHPHTSAGRVPTERGYRFYADELLERLGPRPARFPLDLATSRREIESALQSTTEMLSDVTRLLALVTAPPLETATVRHVEVLLLQPSLVMVVTITSTGGVAKRMFTFLEPVDPGLAKWAHEYLNERLAGVQLGSSDLRRRVGRVDGSDRREDSGALDGVRQGAHDHRAPILLRRPPELREIDLRHEDVELAGARHQIERAWVDALRLVDRPGIERVRRGDVVRERRLEPLCKARGERRERHARSLAMVG